MLHGGAKKRSDLSTLVLLDVASHVKENRLVLFLHKHPHLTWHRWLEHYFAGNAAHFSYARSQTFMGRYNSLISMLFSHTFFQIILTGL